jgi:hypothetical protein
MPQEKFPEQALRAKEKLMAQYFNHPEVEMIDIGYDLENPGAPRRVVLRVHTRPTDRPTLNLPTEVDGVPVSTITADYKTRG